MKLYETRIAAFKFKDDTVFYGAQARRIFFLLRGPWFDLMPIYVSSYEKAELLALNYTLKLEQKESNPNDGGMDNLRVNFKKLRKTYGFTQSSFNGIMSRHTVKRFEDGGDITLSKIVDAVEKMGKRVIILM